MTARRARSAPPTLSRRFAAVMARFGAFEAAPHLAVAVSGGADSLALALLAQGWAAKRGGRVTALTVDHRLRPDARHEAAWVKAALARHGIAHRVLTWHAGAQAGRANLQARARAARYDLLADWCRKTSVMHLLTAHHRDDQAETVLMRLERGSGLYGLAAMASCAEQDAYRLLRPLLAEPKSALAGYLRRRGQDWIEDPSNENPEFTRVRLRRTLAEGAADGLDAARLAATAARLGADRAAMDGALAALLARAAAPDPAGFVVLDRDLLCAAPEALGLRVLARVLVTVGGADYAPRFARLRGLYDEISGAGRARTLGGCTIRRLGGGRPGSDRLLICREAAAEAGALAVSGPGRVVWDNRFELLVRGRGGVRGWRVAPLTREGWVSIKGDTAGSADPGGGCRALPAAVRWGLPALWGPRGVAEVPHLGYRRRGRGVASLAIADIRFRPPQPLAGPVFAAFEREFTGPNGPQ